MFPATVVVGLDASDAAERALGVAVELCAATGSALHLAHVKAANRRTEGARDPSPARSDQLREEGEQLLERHRRALADAGVDVAGTHVRGGAAIDRSLVRLCDELHADLLVVGGSGGGSGSTRRLVDHEDPSADAGRRPRSVLVVA